MPVLPLFTALITLLEYRVALRREREIQPGAVVGEEKGATFGKVVGIEEAIAEHAINVIALKSASEKLFSSIIEDDRKPKKIDRIAPGCFFVVRSAEYADENYGIDVPSAKNGTPISASSPFAQAFIGKKVGDKIYFRGIIYEITEITSSSDHQTIDLLINEYIDETKRLSEMVSKTEVDRFGQSLQKRKVEVANILDRIQLLVILLEMYENNKNFPEIDILREKFENESHVPIDDIKSSGSFLFILEQLNRNK